MVLNPYHQKAFALPQYIFKYLTVILMGLSPRKIALPEATLMERGRFSSSSVLDQSNYAENGRVQQGSAPELDGCTGMYSESNG